MLHERVSKMGLGVKFYLFPPSCVSYDCEYDDEQNLVTVLFIVNVSREIARVHMIMMTDSLNFLSCVTYS